jgi:plastocyanin
MTTMAALCLGIMLSACLPPSSPPPPTPTVTAAPAATPVSGAAPIPLAAPTPGGMVPTIVGSPVPARPAPAATAISTPPAFIAGRVSLSPDRQFLPSLLSIEVGQAVEWVNYSRGPRTVTCDPSLVDDKSLVVLPAGARPFASAALNADDSFVHVFDTPGEYQYVSLPFETEMVARVSVRR